MNRGYVNTEDKLYQLKALQDAGKKVEVRERVTNKHPTNNAILLSFRLSIQMFKNLYAMSIYHSN